MAIFRNVNMTFWTDTKVTDNYTPEDRYFMLWALTNNYTNIIGCYEVSIKQISNDLGYNKDVIENLIKRFKEIHNTIDYDYNTNELLVKNWNKFNWSISPKLDLPLYNAIKKVKSDIFYNELALLFNNRLENVDRKDDTVLIPYRYGMDTTIAITSTIPITITNTIKEDKKNNNYFEDEELNDLFVEFLSIRKKLKAQNTDSAIKVLVTKLNKYNDDTKKQMIENSIENSWKGLFEIKGTKNIETKPKWFDNKIEKESASKEELEEIQKIISCY